MARASFKRPATLKHTYNRGDHLKTVKTVGRYLEKTCIQRRFILKYAKCPLHASYFLVVTCYSKFWVTQSRCVFLNNV